MNKFINMPAGRLCGRSTTSIPIAAARLGILAAMAALTLESLLVSGSSVILFCFLPVAALLSFPGAVIGSCFLAARLSPGVCWNRTSIAMKARGLALGGLLGVANALIVLMGVQCRMALPEDFFLYAVAGLVGGSTAGFSTATLLLRRYSR